MAINSTVTESDIKPPYDSDLLASSVKEIWAAGGQTLTATPLYEYTRHNRAVKDAARKCIYACYAGAGEEERHQHYKKLLQLTRKSWKVLIEATVTLADARQQGQCLLADDADKWQADVDHLLPLVDAIVSQTERRIFKGEKVPAQEKVVSLYEPHTDIIVKDRRQVQYGHKLNLVQGKKSIDSGPGY